MKQKLETSFISRHKAIKDLYKSIEFFGLLAQKAQLGPSCRGRSEVNWKHFFSLCSLHRLLMFPNMKIFFESERWFQNKVPCHICEVKREELRKCTNAIRRTLKKTKTILFSALPEISKQDTQSKLEELSCPLLQFCTHFYSMAYARALTCAHFSGLSSYMYSRSE